MSLSGVSMVIRSDLCAELGNILNWPGRNVSGAIQRMADTQGEEGAARILNGVLAHRNKEIATVAAQGGDMIRTSGDFIDERGRMSNQTRWFNFGNAAWGSIHKYTNGEI